MNSEELFQRSLKVAPGGVHSPVRAFRGVGGTPIFFNKADGAYIYSVEGQKYVDYCMSFGPHILGHRDVDVQKEVNLAIQDSWSLGAADPYSLELAEWITSHVPWAEKVRFVCSGTEAVMSALRVARAATGRNQILKFDGCYHGHVDSMLVKAGSGLAEAASSDSAGVSEKVASDTIVVPLDNIEAVKAAFKKHGSDIAAICLEPLPANYGLLIQKIEFIQEVVNLARANKSLVLFDEVISGFRVAIGGMAEILNIKPDLVTYGKIIGGGFPVGAYAGKAELMNMVAPQGPVYQAGTLAGNPVGMRAGLATLKKMEKVNGYELLAKRTQIFKEKLESGFSDLRIPMKVASYASLFWLHLDIGQTIRNPSQFAPDQKEKFSKLFHAVLKRGIYLAPSAFEVGFVSLAHTDQILDETCQILLEEAKILYAP
jgi:glutamate-1-semialdehyde 2,1-aminomutase